MAIVDRQVFSLGVVNFPLEKWKICSSGDVIYSADPKKLNSDRKAGFEKVIRNVTVVGENEIQINYLVRITPLDGELPRLHVYESESRIFSNEEINRALGLGCSLGKKKQIQWKE